AHPGLSFLIMSDGSPQALAALSLGSQIARLAHARVTVLGYGLPPQQLQRHLGEIKEQFGSGLAPLEMKAAAGPLSQAIACEVERQSYDLVVWGFQRQENMQVVEQILESGKHH